LLGDSLYSQKGWTLVLGSQVKEINELPGAKVTSSNYVDKFPEFDVHHQAEYQWKTSGYQHLQVELKCNAIVECDPRGTRKPYKLNTNELTKVKVLDKFVLNMFFPRGFPEDKLAWTIFFDPNTVPLYPNIAKTRPPDHMLNYFSDYAPRGNPNVSGMLCLAASTTDSNLSRILTQLTRYLRMEEIQQYIKDTDLGLNDGGFDPGLLEHMLMNFSEFQALIKNHKSSERKVITFEKKKRKDITF
jgi:hypothetical protein